MNPPSEQSPPLDHSRVRAFVRRHPRKSVFLFMLFASASITWPVYTDQGSLIAGLLATLSFSGLLYALERSFASSWPYHYAWAAACAVLAIILPVAGSLHYDLPLGDLLVNMLFVGVPFIGLALYGVLRA
jgi:hypothetical protein